MTCGRCWLGVVGHDSLGTANTYLETRPGPGVDEAAQLEDEARMVVGHH